MLAARATPTSVRDRPAITPTTRQPGYLAGRGPRLVTSGPGGQPDAARPAARIAAALHGRRPVSTASRPPGWQLYETETASVQPAVAYCHAQLASMHVGKEFPALGSAHGNPHDGFPARAVLGSAVHSVMPDGPEVPAQACTTTSAARTGLTASARRRSR